jgi:predicted O-methyltransferase YrrM
MSSLRQPFFDSEEYRHIDARLPEVLKALPQAPEGHISPQQAEFLYAFIRMTKPTFIAETGLCVGHSAMVMLLAQQSVGIDPCVMSVDSCQYSETRTAASWIGAHYEHFVFIEGDSKSVLQEAVNTYLRRRENLTLGFGMIDGGHDELTVAHDLRILFSFLVNGGFLWLDDFEKLLPNSGVNIAGHDFSRKWGSCHRFRGSGNRGIMLYQKGF